MEHPMVIMICSLRWGLMCGVCGVYVYVSMLGLYLGLMPS